MQARKASEWSCISGITEDSFNLSRTNQQMHQLFGMRGRAFSLSHSLKAESDTFELSAATLPFSPFHSAEERRLSTTRKSSDLFDFAKRHVSSADLQMGPSPQELIFKQTGEPMVDSLFAAKSLEEESGVAKVFHVTIQYYEIIKECVRDLLTLSGAGAAPRGPESFALSNESLLSTRRNSVSVRKPT
eukprot:gene3437-5384_t